MARRRRARATAPAVPIFTIAAAAAYLGLAAATFRRHVLPTLAVARAGRRYLITQRQLDAFVHRAGPGRRLTLLPGGAAPEGREADASPRRESVIRTTEGADHDDDEGPMVDRSDGGLVLPVRPAAP
jgi:hypothetical protein